MIKIKQLLTEDRTEVDHGCLMAMVKKEDATRIIKLNKKLIPESILYKEGDEYGRESEIHLTLFYGYTVDLTEDQIKDIIKDQSQFPVELTKISQFKNGKEKGYDVVICEANSDILNKLNDKASEFPNENEYPNYKQHLTLGYVKPDSFEYDDKDINLKVNIDIMCYSPIKGEKSYFKLPEKKKEKNSLKEYSLDVEKEPRITFLKSEILKMEKEIDRLDNMGIMGNKIKELVNIVNNYKNELKGWKNYNS